MRKDNYLAVMTTIVTLMIAGAIFTVIITNNREDEKERKGCFRTEQQESYAQQQEAQRIRDSIKYSVEPMHDFEKVSKEEFGSNVYSFIIKLNIAHPEIVFRLAVIESGNFEPNLFRAHNIPLA
jgi:hypothetical protein